MLASQTVWIRIAGRAHNPKAQAQFLEPIATASGLTWSLRAQRLSAHKDQSSSFVTAEDRHELGNEQNPWEVGRGFLPTVMPRPHQAASTLMECNHKIQIRFVSSPGSVILISCAHRCLTPNAITLQFQWMRGLDNRRNAACGICRRVVVTKLVRCQGGRDE